MPMSNIIHFHQHELMTKSLLQVREDIMEQSMVYEGYVKSEGVYQGEGRLLFKNGTTVVWTTSNFVEYLKTLQEIPTRVTGLREPWKERV